MKKLIFLSALFFVQISFGQTTPIPDANFEAELIALGIDRNGANGTITNADAASATGYTSNRTDITNFQGLEAFVNLTKLNLGRNQFTTVPLTTLTNLEELIFNENRVLASIDLSQNTELRILNIASIATINPSTMTSIDLSNNTKLEEINIFNFQDLEFYTLPITNTLRKIRIHSNFDLPADLSGYNNLEEIDLGVVKDKFIFMTPPDEKLNLKIFRISRGEIRDFRYLENYTNLELISVRSLTEQISLPQTPTLTFIQINGHGITIPMSFQGIPNLVDLDIRANTSDVPLSIDISSNAALQNLNLSDNKMADLDVQSNGQLVILTVTQNNLERLDLDGNPLLDRLTASSNLLSNIDVRSNPLLRRIRVSDNRLTALDITQNTRLEELEFDTNLFAGQGPDLTQNPELFLINGSFNKMTSLNISQNLKIRFLDLSNNQFSGNNIVNQIHQNYVAAGRSLGAETYLLNDNLLSDTLPNFASLVNGSTQDFSFSIHNNNLQFGDFEAHHQQYVNFRDTPRGGSFIFSRYWYANQNKVNVEETITTIAGQQVVMATVVRGSQNHYQWFRNGVPIAGAADSPEYIIPNPDACESGVYHAEVTSDLVPLEDAEAPGNNGKNLVLVRNDISLGTNGVPTCANLIEPLNNAIEVPINSGIEWESDSGACGYIITVGTTSGGNDIINNEDVGNVTAYNFQNNLPENQLIFVQIQPYFSDGSQLDCDEESFLTNDELKLPDCTEILQPTTGSVGVAPFTNILWQASNGADGYLVKIGTQPGAGDLYDFDAGDTTSFDPPVDFAEDQTFYVTITPYNSVGEPLGCAIENFSTASDGAFLSCTILTTPLNSSVNVDVNSSIQWAEVANAIGYRLTVGTTTDGSEIFTGDVGNNTLYNFENELPADTDIFVTITPYDIDGDADSCTTESFRTAPIIPIPDCTSLLFPVAGSREVNPSVNIAWNGAPRALGYVLEVGTNPGVYDFFSEDVGLRTSFNFPTALPAGSPIYVRVTPYNREGSPEDCIEESFSTSEPVKPICSTLVGPIDGEEAVSVDTNLSWEFVSNANGYLLNVGTSSGNYDIISEDVGGVTFYDFQDALPEVATIYVQIIPYNDEGEAESCIEESFTTALAPVIPECTALLEPINGQMQVNALTNFAWSPISNADGYILRIGTTSGGSDIFVDNVGNASSFDYDGQLPAESDIYVTITPFNEEGDAIGCIEEFFTTEIEPMIPACSTLIMPFNNDTEISTSTNLSWSNVFSADGYILEVGSSSGSNDLFSQDVGPATWFDLPNNLPENATIYVNIIAYNDLGMAIDCFEEQFETTSEPTLPSCTSMLVPFDLEEEVNPGTNIAWGLVDNADGYVLEVGTSPGVYDFFSEDIGLRTSFNLQNALPSGSTIYVRITPYNDQGSASDCIEQSFTTSNSMLPNCTSLLGPLNGEELVSVNTNFSWDFVSNAEGYILNIGSSAGNYDLFSEDVAGVTFYDLDNLLPENAPIYVLIVPYNQVGQAIGCIEESFTTSNAPELPNCPQLLEPRNGDIQVDVSTNFAWEAINNADGYTLQIGTSSGSADLFNGNVNAANSFDFDGALPENTPIYVNIIPFNELGEGEGCVEEVFTTALAPTIPACPVLTMPLNNASAISVDTNLSWTPIANADGYILEVGSSPGANDLFSADIGRASWFDLPDSLPENAPIYVSVAAYNNFGTSTGCNEEQFVTTDTPTLPSCTTILIPTNNEQEVNVTTNIAWGLVSNADGYLLNVGTASQGADIFSGDVGNTTWYDLPQDLPESTTIFVTVIPYNNLGQAVNCIEESFVTAGAPTVPSCTILLFPLNGSQGVNPEINSISWVQIDDVTGYFVSVGTAPGVFDIADNVDVGLTTEYVLAGALPFASSIFVEIKPYNAIGINDTCPVASFTTADEVLEPVPNCTDIFEPLNGQSNIGLTTTIRWNELANANGYVLTLGTAEGETDILDTFDVGNVTAYEVSGLPAASVIYATVSAYNEVGFPEGCSFSTFITVFDEENINDTKFGLTPNGDGLNDFWRIDGIEQYPDNVVRIFNRWGDEVYKTIGYDNLRNAFSGEANQKIALGAGQLPSGTYFFDIQIEGDHDIDVLRGYIILKRE